MLIGNGTSNIFFSGLEEIDGTRVTRQFDFVVLLHCTNNKLYPPNNTINFLFVIPLH